MATETSESKPPLVSGEGHRQRLKARFDATGLEGFSEHEVLEMLLFYTLPRRDTKAIAKVLLAEFKSLEGVFSAKREVLQGKSGIGSESARFLHLVRAIHEQVLKVRAHGAEASISSVSDLMNFLRATMANLGEEEFRVIYVDHANVVKKVETLWRGTEDQTVVYPREVMKRALALQATGILVVHNHPTGFLKPSQADRDITKTLKSAASALEIRLLDHVIIGREGKGYFSFRENGLLV